MEPRNRRREKVSVGLSVLLHALATPLFIAVIMGSTDLRPEGQTAASGIFSITVVHRAAPAPPRPAVARQVVQHVAAPVQSPSHERHAVVVAATQRHQSGNPTKTRRVSLVDPVPTPEPVPTPTRTAAAVHTVAAANADSTEKTTTGVQATTAPAEQATPVRAMFAEAPPGGWGQNFRDPMVFDDAALAALRSHYRGIVAHVDVDEDGHAVHVTLEGSGLDSDSRADIERQLMTVRYVPAECNGLRCAASLVLQV